MKTLLKTKIIVSIIVIITVLITVILCFCPIAPLNKLESGKVVSVGFAGEDNGEVFYVYPQNQAEEFINILKEAKLSGIPTRKFHGYKGGAPTFITRVILEDGVIDISYLKAEGKTFLIINGLKYRCDEQTIESFRNISNECEKLFEEKNNPTE